MRPHVADTELVNGIRVERWRKAGKDRLYINGDDNHRLGWCDRDDQVVTVDNELDRPVVQAAVEKWRADEKLEAPVSPPTPAAPVAHPSSRPDEVR